jgi:hypothetical protein
VAFHLRERNQRHFGQAAGSPFTAPPLSSHLGYDAQTQSADDILHGEYQYRGSDPNVALLLKYLKHSEEVSRTFAASYERGEKPRQHHLPVFISGITKLS